MAWARVTSATLGNNAGSTASPWNAGNLGAAVAAGNRLFAAITYDTATGSPHVSAVSDSVNGAWTNMLVLASTGSAKMEWSLWTVISGAGTPSSITITFAGGTGGMGIGVSVGAYSGLSSSTNGSEIDVSKMLFSSTGAMDSGTTAASTTAANELKMGLYGDFGVAATVVAGTLDTTYSLFQNNSPSGNTQTALEDADSGSSGATARATFTGVSGTVDTTTAVAVIKLAGTVTTLPPGLGPVVAMDPGVQSAALAAMMR